jgi:hypothetical protein
MQTSITSLCFGLEEFSQTFRASWTSAGPKARHAISFHSLLPLRLLFRLFYPLYFNFPVFMIYQLLRPIFHLLVFVSLLLQDAQERVHTFKTYLFTK